MQRLTSLTSVLVLSIACLAACGDDDGPNDAATDAIADVAMDMGAPDADGGALDDGAAPDADAGSSDGGPMTTGAWSTQEPSGCSDAHGAFDAFIPGMRGHGSCNRGGFVPGTNVIIVDTTASSGPGSLDAALDASCPKVVLFAVSGVIETDGPSYVTNTCDDWSLVGASAPGNVTVTDSINALIAATGSRWTIDHLTLAAGDVLINPSTSVGLRRSLVYGPGGTTAAATHGILLNNNLIWGADETVTCYPNPGAEQDYMLTWQNVIGYPVGGAGVHIVQDTCRFHNSIRNVYLHSIGRNAFTRGHGFMQANALVANPGQQSILIQPCNSTFNQGPEMFNNYPYNLTVYGPNSSSVNPVIYSKHSTSCTDVQYGEFGNQLMHDDNTIADCSDHACVRQTDGSDATLLSSRIESIYPEGYVPETFTGTQSSLLEFTTRVTSYAGARPLDRVPLIAAGIEQSINMVDGAGDEGGWQGPTFPPNGHDTTDDMGGVAAISSPGSDYDPTSGSDNPCGDDMPTGAAADTIESSGLTRLHEWVIGCFYDHVMPPGYREGGLEGYPAPR